MAKLSYGWSPPQVDHKIEGEKKTPLVPMNYIEGWISSQLVAILQNSFFFKCKLFLMLLNQNTLDPFKLQPHILIGRDRLSNTMSIKGFQDV